MYFKKNKRKVKSEVHKGYITIVYYIYINFFRFGNYASAAFSSSNQHTVPQKPESGKHSVLTLGSRGFRRSSA